MLRHEDLFHVGIVVDDLRDGMTSHGAPLGLKWRECFFPSPEVLTSSGMRTMQAGAVYSQNGPIHYELLQRYPGGLWDRCGLHHLGYFTDDLHSDIQRLRDSGFTAEGVMHRDGVPIAAYLVLEGTTRVELVPRDAAVRLLGRPV